MVDIWYAGGDGRLIATKSRRADCQRPEIEPVSYKDRSQGSLDAISSSWEWERMD